MIESAIVYVVLYQYYGQPSLSRVHDLTRRLALYKILKYRGIMIHMSINSLSEREYRGLPTNRCNLFLRGARSAICQSNVNVGQLTVYLFSGV